MTNTFYFIEADYNERPRLARVLARECEGRVGRWEVLDAPDWSYLDEGDYIGAAETRCESIEAAVREYQKRLRKQNNDYLQHIEDNMETSKKVEEWIV